LQTRENQNIAVSLASRRTTAQHLLHESYISTSNVDIVEHCLFIYALLLLSIGVRLLLKSDGLKPSRLLGLSPPLFKFLDFPAFEPPLFVNSTQLNSTGNYGRRCVHLYVRIYFL